MMTFITQLRQKWLGNYKTHSIHTNTAAVTSTPKAASSDAGEHTAAQHSTVSIHAASAAPTAPTTETNTQPNTQPNAAPATKATGYSRAMQALFEQHYRNETTNPWDDVQYGIKAIYNTRQYFETQCNPQQPHAANALMPLIIFLHNSRNNGCYSGEYSSGRGRYGSLLADVCDYVYTRHPTLKPSIEAQLTQYTDTPLSEQAEHALLQIVLDANTI